MASSDSKNKISFYTTLIFLILLLMCASPPMIQAAGSSDDEDSTTRKSKGYQEAVSYIKKLDYSSATPLLRRELKKNPRDADAHNYMGYVLRKSGDFENSAVHYAKALEINPQHLGECAPALLRDSFGSPWISGRALPDDRRSRPRKSQFAKIG